MVSKLVHWAAWLAAILTAAASVYWIAVIADGNYCWSAFGFTLGIALPLGAGILFLGVIPSAGLYLRTRQRRDWIGLAVTGSAFAILLVEVIVINFIIPQRGE